MVSYEIKLDEEKKIVLVSVVGEVLVDEGEKIISEARGLAVKHGFDILYDMRRSTSKIQISNWFRLPRKLDVYKHPESRLTRAAVLVTLNDPSLEQYKFFETVSKNLGFSLKVFFKREDAFDWLGFQSINTTHTSSVDQTAE